MPRCIVRHNYHHIAIFYWLFTMFYLPLIQGCLQLLGPLGVFINGGLHLWKEVGWCDHTCTHTTDTQGQESCNKLRHRVEHPWKEEEWVMTTVPTQQYWFWRNIDYMLAWCKAYFIGSCTHLNDVVLFHWLVQIKTVDSAQPRNCSIVTRPISSWEGGVWA